MYYLRTKPAAINIKFTIDKSKLAQSTPNGSSSNSVAATSIDAILAAVVCSLENKDDCLWHVRVLNQRFKWGFLF